LSATTLTGIEQCFSPLRPRQHNVESTSNWSNFWHAFVSRGFVSDSWNFLYLSEPDIITLTVLPTHSVVE